MKKIWLGMVFVACMIHADFYTQLSYSETYDHFDLDASVNACEKGDARECAKLGLTYIKGTKEIEKNYKKSKLFAEKACQYKNKIGCMIMLNIDDIERRELLNQSCADGNNTACADLQVLKDKKYYIVDGKCSRCGSTHIGKYLYGLIDPDKKMQEKIDRGEIVLNGCMIYKNSPKYYCPKCGVDLHEQDKKSEHTNSNRERKDNDHHSNKGLLEEQGLRLVN